MKKTISKHAQKSTIQTRLAETMCLDASKAHLVMHVPKYRLITVCT